ncbi:MAG: hypothetical protein JST01_06060 [Cyanobacteria bacterium SZAS TMP-1]|nr:hypothetical protein [Cyanobacteria bacterium SZAS TMP-1]
MPSAPKYDLEQATAILTAVAETLADEPWFAKGNWHCSVHNFPPPPAAPESVTLHLSKAHWFNEEHQGIHFETFLSPQQWRTGEIPVMLHILHTPLIPGTKIKRIKLSQPFVDHCYETVSTWPDYTFRTGKYGTQPFSCKIDFKLDNRSKLKSDLVREFSRMGQKLGPLMDKTLKDILGN